MGGYVPFVGKVTHDRLQLYLSLSAGVMLGAAFFHVMPDAMERCNGPFAFGCWISLGVIGLFCIERFIAPHSHEIDGEVHHHHAESHAHQHAGEASHSHGAKGVHGDTVMDRRAAAPSIAGWAAVFGLTIHTFMNGVGLAGSVQNDMDVQAGEPHATAPVGFMLPGLALFFAIVFHKPADALAISTVLSRKGVSRAKIALVQLGFALMVPIGAGAFMLTRGAIAKDLQNQLTGAALAFSAGTFLFIALSDLLPEVHFHRHDRIPLFLALLSGVVLMAAISLLEPHEAEHDGHESGEKTGQVGHDGHHNEGAHDHEADPKDHR
jgi:zinc and cadmium transporter